MSKIGVLLSSFVQNGVDHLQDESRKLRRSTTAHVRAMLRHRGRNEGATPAASLGLRWVEERRSTLDRGGRDDAVREWEIRFNCRHPLSSARKRTVGRAGRRKDVAVVSNANRAGNAR